MERHRKHTPKASPPTSTIPLTHSQRSKVKRRELKASCFILEKHQVRLTASLSDLSHLTLHTTNRECLWDCIYQDIMVFWFVFLNKQACLIHKLQINIWAICIQTIKWQTVKKKKTHHKKDASSKHTYGKFYLYFKSKLLKLQFQMHFNKVTWIIQL